MSGFMPLNRWDFTLHLYRGGTLLTAACNSHIGIRRSWNEAYFYVVYFKVWVAVSARVAPGPTL